MSDLFGSSPPQSSSAPTDQTIFGEDSSGTPAKSSTSRKIGDTSLFHDGGGDDDADTPFEVTPSKNKKSRESLVKSLLPPSSVPESYVDAYDALLELGESVSGKVSFTAVERVLQGSGIGVTERAQVLELVAPPDRQSEAASLGREEFNVLLALIGLAQEKEDISLDGVDERRSRLPEPKLPPLKPQAQEPPTDQTSHDDSAQQPPKTPTTDRSTRPTSTAQSSMPNTLFADPGADPWASPSNTVKQSKQERTTSAFTTSGDKPTDEPTKPFRETPAASGAEDWGGYNNNRDSGFGGSGDFGDNGGFGGGLAGAGGEGDAGNDFPSSQIRTGVATKRRQHVSQGAQETYSVMALPEKEGMFLFQYRNYEIASARKNTKVIRRYSDFVWLLDCLHKKYPFRLLPLLPPKRVSINGNHLATDALFIEKRRRGLTRFVNTVIQHPVLKDEQLVQMFLTVPTELAAYRKQATTSLTEEFANPPSVPTSLEDSLPTNLEDLFDTVRSGVRRSADLYINLCNTLERLTKRRDGVASEYARLSTHLSSLTEASGETYQHQLQNPTSSGENSGGADAADLDVLNESLHASAKHLNRHAESLDTESRSWEEEGGVVEEMKGMRDCIVGMRDLFDRRDRLARDNIPSLEKRIVATEGKLAGVRGKPEGARKPGEAERLEESILRDKAAITSQHARQVLIKRCILDEIAFFTPASQQHLGRLQADWANERVRVAGILEGNWKMWMGEVEGLGLVSES